MHYDAVVIGAGIFGSLIARAFRKSGMTVKVLDAGHASSGSKPAACLMRPGWFASMGKANYEPALKMLDYLVGVKDLEFSVAKGLVKATVHWCPPRKLLLTENEYDIGNVQSIYEGSHGRWYILPDNAPAIAAKTVVVAAGIWTSLLYPEVRVDGQGGSAWLWPKATIEEPFIKVWAPYKQIVAFNRGDGLWCGDGMTARDWNETHTEQSRNRCFYAVSGKNLKGLLPKDQQPRQLFGYRPYVPDIKPDPCFLKEIRKGVWVATGGAKNGTIAAAWCVNKLLERLA